MSVVKLSPSIQSVLETILRIVHRVSGPAGLQVLAPDDAEDPLVGGRSALYEQLFALTERIEALRFLPMVARPCTDTFVDFSASGDVPRRGKLLCAVSCQLLLDGMRGLEADIRGFLSGMHWCAWKIDSLLRNSPGSAQSDKVTEGENKKSNDASVRPVKSADDLISLAFGELSSDSRACSVLSEPQRKAWAHDLCKVALSAECAFVGVQPEDSRSSEGKTQGGVSSTLQVVSAFRFPVRCQQSCARGRRVVCVESDMTWASVNRSFPGGAMSFLQWLVQEKVSLIICARSVSAGLADVMPCGVWSQVGITSLRQICRLMRCDLSPDVKKGGVSELPGAPIELNVFTTGRRILAHIPCPKVRSVLLPTHTSTLTEAVVRVMCVLRAALSVKGACMVRIGVEKELADALSRDSRQLHSHKFATLSSCNTPNSITPSKRRHPRMVFHSRFMCAVTSFVKALRSWHRRVYVPSKTHRWQLGAAVSEAFRQMVQNVELCLHVLDGAGPLGARENAVLQK